MFPPPPKKLIMSSREEIYFDVEKLKCSVQFSSVRFSFITPAMQQVYKQQNMQIYKKKPKSNYNQSVTQANKLINTTKSVPSLDISQVFP